jgi:glycosyltransferase involved in cell wall biosynthesis
MLIGIDGNEANIRNRVGVNVYAYEILKNFSLLQDEWKAKHKIVVYLKENPLQDLPKETQFFKYKVISGGSFWIIRKLTPNIIFDTPRPDIFFTPSHYIPPFLPIPCVCSIMDLGYLNFSEQFKKKDFWQLKFWSAYSINISKAIIAISEATKNDIVRHYPSASKKVSVTLLSYNKDRFNGNVSDLDVRRVKNKYKLCNNYILFLSTLKPSKNIGGLIEACAILNSQLAISNEKNKTKLVIAGKKGWMFESIFEKVKKLKLENDIVFTDFVPEEDKPAIIAGAKVFVLPSFWEGFGIDVLEAMACGVPVIISKVGSLPEVGGKAAIYINPENTKSIAEGIGKVLLMGKKEYNKVVEAGLAQVNKFSWEKAARETLRILESAV